MVHVTPDLVASVAVLRDLKKIIKVKRIPPKWNEKKSNKIIILKTINRNLFFFSLKRETEFFIRTIQIQSYLICF